MITPHVHLQYTHLWYNVVVSRVVPARFENKQQTDAKNTELD